MSLPNINRGLSERLKMDKPAIYRIVVSGRLDNRWADLFGGLNITEISGEGKRTESVLVGRMADQSELSGVLTALYDSRFPVISVDCLEEI